MSAKPTEGLTERPKNKQARCVPRFIQHFPRKKLCKQIPTPEEVKEERLKSAAEFQQRAEKEFQKRGKSKNIIIKK